MKPTLVAAIAVLMLTTGMAWAGCKPGDDCAKDFGATASPPEAKGVSNMFMPLHKDAPKDEAAPVAPEAKGVSNMFMPLNKDDTARAGPDATGVKSDGKMPEATGQ